MTYSPQSPPPASPWGWDLSYEAGARRRGRALGAPAGLQAPSRHQGPGGELGNEALLRRLRTGGQVHVPSLLPLCQPPPRPPGRTAARPPCLPSPQDVSLGRPGGPPWPVRPHRSPGPRNWLPHALPGRCESRPLSRWWGGAAAFSGVLHPGQGLVSPLCSPQKLCPLAPVLGEHGRRSGSQPPQGGKRETLLTFPPSSEKGEQAAWRSRAGPGRGGGSHVGRWSPTERQLQTIRRGALDSAFLMPGQVVPSCM